MRLAKIDKAGKFMFLIGLFSQTQIQVVGSIAISELVFFFLAPFVFVGHMTELRRDRVMPALNLIVLAMIGCVISSVANHTYYISALKGFSTIYGLWAGIVIFYVLLRKSPMSFRWYLLGSAFSFVLCTFAFQQAVEVHATINLGANTAEAIASGPIYWIGRLSGFVMWPIQAFYLQCPLVYSALGTFIFGAWSMLTSASGRSAALGATMSTVVILIGRKSVRSMKLIHDNFWVLIGGFVLVVFLFKVIYGFTASNGMLGEEAQKKYEGQTRGKSSLMSIIKGGRGEVFVGAYACSQKPIIGYGPWAIDNYGIVADYMTKYADSEQIEEYFKRMNSSYNTLKMSLIPAHSALIGWWLWYGILGVPFWLYLMYRIYRCLRYDIYHVPEFFGYLAVTLPTQLWGTVFSPFGARLPWAFFVTMILLVRVMKVDDIQRMWRRR